MEDISSILRTYFPSLNDPDLLEEIVSAAEIREMPADNSLMDFGQYIREMPLLYEGIIKVLREDEEGNELFLYYVYPGQACAISLVCSGRDRISQIRAEAVEPLKFLSIPIDYMDDWMQRYRVWYQFVLGTYQARMQEMLETIDSVAFQKMDQRLISYLQQTANAKASKVIKTTHQDIAYELNTSREVISRLLKKLEQRGEIKLGRNQIELLN